MYNSGGMERVLSVCANALCQDVDISIITLYQKRTTTLFSNGFLISKVGDVSTMAFKISQLIESEDLRRQMGNEAKRMVEKSFSITVIMEEWKNLIMTAI